MSFSDSTTPAPLDDRAARKDRRPRYDPTVNLGHVLTFIGFIATGAAGYFDLRERVSLTDGRVDAVEKAAAVEKTSNHEDVQELKSDVREIRSGVQTLLLRQAAGSRP